MSGTRIPMVVLARDRMAADQAGTEIDIVQSKVERSLGFLGRLRIDQDKHGY